MADAAVAEQTAASEPKTEQNDNKPPEATANGDKADSGDNGEEKPTGAKQDGAHEGRGYRNEPNESGRDRRSGGRGGDKYDHKRRDRYDRNDRRGGSGGGGRGGGRGRGAGRGRGTFRDRQQNVRTKFARDEESSDTQEIRRQVEFYFSDSNLPIDKFLLEETGGPQNKPFPLKTIHNFKRMRHFQPFSAIVEAVKGSDFLEVNAKDEVYRKEPLDNKFTLDVKENQSLLTTDSMRRSIYAKGFGEERTRTAFEIEEFFQPYGVRSVRLRRSEDGTFKGSVFVEFEDEDTAKQFLDMEDKPKYDEREVETMSKQEYVDMKSQAILEGKVMPKSPTRKGSFRGRGSHQNRPDGGFKRKRYDEFEDEADADKDDWRARRERFQRGKKDGRSRSRSPYHAEKDEEAEPVLKKTKTDDSGEVEAAAPKADENKENGTENGTEIGAEKTEGEKVAASEKPAEAASATA